VLVTEAQSSRTFTIRAEGLGPADHAANLCGGDGGVELPTMHPSEPLLLKVAVNKQDSKRKPGQANEANNRR